MATVWAKNNGNWSDTTLWAFWNENTQQIEDYGQVPQVDDVVYCNGYTVTILQSLIEVKELHNGVLSYTGRFGGNFTGYNTSNSILLRCDMYSEVADTYLFYLRGSTYNTPMSQQIIGNLHSREGWILQCTDARHDISINGNFSGKQLLYFSSGAGTKVVNMTINGNLDCNIIGKSSNNASSPPINITINGSLVLHDTIVEYGRNLNFTLNGIFQLKDTATLDVTLYTGYTSYTITLNGVLVIGRNQLINLFTNNGLSLKTIDGLGVRLEGDYPVPTNVKNDVPYAWGEFVGQYTPDYPPESVVLKDYEYGDSGDRKTGTMPVLSQQLISRLENCATVETVQQLLVAHLDN